MVIGHTIQELRDCPVILRGAAIMVGCQIDPFYSSFKVGRQLPIAAIPLHSTNQPYGDEHRKNAKPQVSVLRSTLLGSVRFVAPFAEAVFAILELIREPGH